MITGYVLLAVELDEDDALSDFDFTAALERPSTALAFPGAGTAKLWVQGMRP